MKELIKWLEKELETHRSDAKHLETLKEDGSHLLDRKNLDLYLKTQGHIYALETVKEKIQELLYKAAQEE